jgi:hypothetical protein
MKAVPRAIARALLAHQGCEDCRRLDWICSRGSAPYERRMGGSIGIQRQSQSHNSYPEPHVDAQRG